MYLNHQEAESQGGHLKGSMMHVLEALELRIVKDLMNMSPKARMWNHLPQNIGQCTSSANFKTMLKSHLFSKAYCMGL